MGWLVFVQEFPNGDWQELSLAEEEFQLTDGGVLEITSSRDEDRVPGFMGPAPVQRYSPSAWHSMRRAG
ncbi:hypothetical protein ACTIVE_4923 [Actinomadura verrucosospora]|uniref:Uncharacterized protein n=1 Tax=Actinomadura verrucosospora TaxID=46165 RepID=A0A7D3VUE4_ACTVE|nr:hypothetical protein ACTIVE_4923 [Actinomadura verrucosospora]